MAAKYSKSMSSGEDEGVDDTCRKKKGEDRRRQVKAEGEWRKKVVEGDVASITD
jgi:hypothetical protein